MIRIVAAALLVTSAIPVLARLKPDTTYWLAPGQQVPLEQSLTDLASPDPRTRLRAVQILKDAASPDAAIPLAKLVVDSQDQIQLEAIAAELNIFLADPIVTRRRVGLVVEMRKTLAAEPVFASGPSALGTRPPPPEVLTALLAAVRDDNPRIGVEALYAFGALAGQPGGVVRRALLRISAPDFAGLLGVADPAIRYGAARVIGRVYEKRPSDEPIDESLGDAVVAALNDKDATVKAAAMEALGRLRYDRAVQALTDLFNYRGRGVEAEAALDAIARIANPGSAPLLTAQLKSRTSALRGIAAEGLGRIGDASALPDIEAALAGERNEGVLLARAFAASVLSDASIDRLVDALGKPRLRDQAKPYLVELAQRRMTTIAGRAQDPDPRVRTDIADILGLSRDEAALPVVETLARDSDPAVARAAARAVEMLRPATTASK